MKKNLIYILVSILGTAILVLFLISKNSRAKALDERLSFYKKDKIPYGTYVAYENLKYVFPEASIFSSRQEPGYWDSLSNYETDQAVIIISPRFEIDEYEMRKLIRFTENGNDVFISTLEIPYASAKLLHCSVNTSDLMLGRLMQQEERDTVKISLSSPPYAKKNIYSYPGRRYDLSFSRLDKTITTELGYNGKGFANFVHFKHGKGNLYIHLAPIAFTNYFLLHKNNMAYYENVLSVISPSTKKIVWDEYFLAKRSQKRKDPNWLSEFMKHEELRWALLTALLALLLYVLMEMRRKQRPIPVIARPKNDSLDFVKTIGRLYYDKGDHKNLSRKMAAYFLEHVRIRYKLATNVLNEEFIKNLQFKTGYEEEELRDIIHFINNLDHINTVSDKQLAAFHKQLENFYTKT